MNTFFFYNHFVEDFHHCYHHPHHLHRSNYSHLNLARNFVVEVKVECCKVSEDLLDYKVDIDFLLCSYWLFSYLFIELFIYLFITFIYLFI